MLVGGLAGCTDAGNDLVDGRFTDAEWEVLEGMAFVKPADSTNAKSDDAAAADRGADLCFEAASPARSSGTIPTAGARSTGPRHGLPGLPHAHGVRRP